MTTYVIPDTSVLLHCVMFNSAEWSSLLNDEDVVLAIPLAVIDELDRFKDDSRRIDRQKKARRLIRKLAKYSETLDDNHTTELPNGMRLMLLRLPASEPSLPTHLDPAVGDDRILAEALLLLGEVGDDNVVLLTSDLGMILRARGRGVASMTPPTGIASSLADSEDARLQREIDRLRNRLPRLQLDLISLQLHTTNSEMNGAGAPGRDVGFTESTINDEVRDEEQRIVELCSRQDDVAVSRLDALPTDLQIAVKYYLEEFEDHLRYDLLSRFGTVLDLSLELRNHGTAPASHVVLDLVFPAGAIAAAVDDLIEYYSKPDIKGAPWQKAQVSPRSGSFDMGLNPALLNFTSPESMRLDSIREILLENQREHPPGPNYTLEFREDMPDYAIRDVRYTPAS